MSSRLRVGIVGCGEVTQIIHLPTLAQVPGLFEVTSLCDVSARVLRGVAARLDGVSTHASYRDLASDPDVDVVLVANPNAYHADAAVAALKAGKHVFIEKPMSMTYAEVDALIEAREASGRTVQVGYMRRYAQAFLQATELVASFDEPIRYARVQDFIGRNALVIEDTSVVLRPDGDVPAAETDGLDRLTRASILEAIGTDDAVLGRCYNLLLGLSSHDLSAMRELLGMPKRVMHAAQRDGGRVISATFDYGDFVCDFATFVDEIPRFDAFLEVHTACRTLRVEYDTPYIRNQPVRLVVTEASGSAGFARQVTIPSRKDSFVVEWEAFYDSATTGTPPKTSVEDARLDLDLFVGIMRHLRSEAAV